MRKSLLVAAGLMLIAMPALSQSPTDAEDHSRSYDRRDRDDLEELLSGIGGGGVGNRLRRGAGFLLRSGDATVAVRCDPQENMRACVDATTTLLERARTALPQGGAPATTPPR
jgi:hypothetical protein